MKAELTRELQQQRDRMYRIALRTVGSHDAALDVVQTASLKAWQQIHKFEGRSSLGSWLFRITINAANDYLRKEQRTPIPLDEIAREQSVCLRIDGRQAELENRELYILAMKNIDELPDDCRDTFMLSQLDGYKYEQIAEIQDIPIGTVASRIHRGKRILLDRLREHY